MGTRVVSLLAKEFIQIFRDPRMRTVVFLPPIIQMLVFGYAARLDVRHIATAVFDQDASRLSRELVAALSSSGYFDIDRYVADAAEARRILDYSEAQLVVRVPPGFEREVQAGRGAAVQLLIDGSDAVVASTVLAYAQNVTANLSARLVVERADRLLGMRPVTTPVQLRSRVWYNENLESRNYFIPGVIGIITSLVSLLLTSMAVVREREIGTIEQIIVTPLRPLELMLGKAGVPAMIAIVDVMVVTLVAVFWFAVPMRGSLVLLLGGTLLFLSAMLSAGLLISTVSATQQQAVMTTFLFFFPAILLSGFAFPIGSMPVAVQWLTLANPLRYYMRFLRSVFLTGAGLDLLWPQLVGMAALAPLFIGLATARFRTKLS
jgi:ABC-2 type transport system permease protein